MPEPHTASLLVSYYESFLRDKDIEAFQRQVASRYLEGTLARLTESGETQARRAAVLALGLVGTYQMNAALARALKDTDPTVRSLAENALWAVWFRADSPENNAMLEEAGMLISKQQYKEAVSLTTRLIERAPRFAEAFNQRAIAEFHLGRYQASAEDCQKALERNPYHIGAFGGLAQCLIRLGRRDEALEVLRKASRLQPFNENLREFIARIETGE